MSINLDKLNQILTEFASTTSDIQGAALVTPDGLPLATTLPGNMDEERVSAMSASMLSLGERIGKKPSPVEMIPPEAEPSQLEQESETTSTVSDSFLNHLTSFLQTKISS